MVSLNSSVSVLSLASTQIDALYAIYNASRGENWVYQEGQQPWNFSQTVVDPCGDQWQGVLCALQCNSTACQEEVVELVLISNNMCGSLAEEIGDLSALVNLTIVNQTFLTNHIPERIGDLHNLQYLSLERTLLQGSLPATLWQLSQLQYLEISDSSIQGSIGEGLGNLTLLTSLNLATNMFMGEVPQEINRLTYLESLSLSSNILSGNVLNDLVALSSLTMIDVSYNDMLGFVPDEIYQLTSLRILQLHSNMFMGSMYALCQITSLESLTVSMNMFQGEVPPDIGNLVFLQVLQMSSNFLTGSLPYEIGNMSQLTYMDAGDNDLSGALPSSIFHLSSLNRLVLYDTFITGSIPTEIQYLSELSYLFLERNLLTGTIPEEISRCSQLMSIVLAANQISGTLSYLLTNLTKLLVLSLPYNMVAGSIPSNLPPLSILEVQANFLSGDLSFLSNTKLIDLVSLNISSNYFTGSVYNVQLLQHLRRLDVSNNFLGGDLISVETFDKLSIVFAQSNMFSGSITTMFSPNNVQLVYIDVSANQLTGPLPGDILGQLPALQIFAAVQNCFSGTLPESLCSSPYLKVLALDGLSTASSCRLPMLPGLSALTAYVLPANAMHGSLPACLFEMASLTSLHLSGNRLTGTIPILDSTGGEYGLQLVDLSLSHNLLSGSLPKALLGDTVWSNIDLSFNKLRGELLDFIVDDSEQTGIHWGTDLSFDINRLSGSIPSSYQNFRSINILRGNIFSCQLGREKQLSDINDPFRDQYVCGSVELNVALLLWSGLIILLGVCWLIWLWMRSGRKVESDSEGRRKGGRTIDDEIGSTVSVGGDQVEERGRRVDSRQYGLELLQMRLAMWTEILHDARMHSCCSPSNIREGTDEIYSVCFLLGGVRRFGLTITLYLILVASPLYITLSLYYGSYEQQYAWTNSAAFLSGQSAAIALLLLFLSVLFVVQVARTSILQKLKPFTSLWDSIESESLQGQALDRDVGDGVLEKSGGILDREVDCKGRNEVINPLPTNSVSVSLASTVPDAEPPVGAIDAKEFVSSQENTPEIESGNAKEGTFSNDSHPAALRNSNCFHFLSKRLWGKGALKAVFISSILTIGNIFIVCLVNGMYIYFSLQSSTERVVLLSLALTIFKLVWGRTLYMAILYLLQPLEKTKHGLVSSRWTVFYSTLMLFNTILAPVFATLLANSNCLYYVWTSPPSIDIGYTFYICNAVDGVSCTSYVPNYHTLTIQPPFNYSYQCSSALLTDYAYVFACKYIILGIFYPLSLELGSAFLEAEEGVRQWINSPVWHQCVNLMVSGVDFLLPPLWKLRSLRKRGCDSDPKGVSGGEKYFGEMTLLASADYAVRLVMMLGTLLTFGVVLPYIAVLICLSLYTNTWLTLLGLARFLDDMPSTGRDVDKTKLTERVEGVVMDEEERWSFLIKKGLALQCRHLFCALQLSIQPLAVLIILFYGFFLFDTEGDRYGPWLGLLFVCLLSGVGAILFWKNQIARAFSKCIVLWMKRDGVCCRCWEGKERDARQTEKELDDQSVDGDKTSVQLTPSFSCSQVSGT
eukprot:scaffold1829_cov194-Ochromonas_danica.AAC.4